eukprot:TRINITY_DN47169_c0_g1_i1.p1 TRINITY_DN47169_c0_g1~~TRINITY_DN47169_c0_g1_i1.p1  ORF type:complete len:563 (+),score=130.53 TRINITY_DN47169_c0_g1_i1:46-1734(+)
MAAEDELPEDAVPEEDFADGGDGPAGEGDEPLEDQEEFQDVEEEPVPEEEEHMEEVDAEEEAPEEAEEAGGLIDEDPHEGREDDVKLSDVPEDMREAVEGSLQLKRMLSGGIDKDDSGKKRKVEELSEVTSEEGKELLARWRLSPQQLQATKYVLTSADEHDVKVIHQSNWRPNPHATTPKKEPKTIAEQLNEKLLHAREDSLVPQGRDAVDVVSAWRFRWKISDEDAKLLNNLNHKDLRYVMKEYDGERSLADLVDEARMMLPADEVETAEEAVPELPGVFAMSRFNRLELIDPQADALVCGDANLTFSHLLAEHREGLGHVGRVVATTFETIEILRERYHEIDQTVKSLESKMSEVLHNVDCTRIAVDTRFKGMENKFGAVYYNFPHAGVVQSFFDNHPFVRWRHENLMHLFFRALRCFVQPGGIVKVSSNANATGVRFSDIILGAKNSEFVHIETFPFLEWQLRNYGRSYGDRRDKGRRPEDGDVYRSQKAYSDMVYCFRYEPSGDTPPKAKVRFPPTKGDILASNEGRLRDMKGISREKKVEEIYELFLTYVQGIHVG